MPGNPEHRRVLEERVASSNFMLHVIFGGFVFAPKTKERGREREVRKVSGVSVIFSDKAINSVTSFAHHLRHLLTLGS